MCTYVPCLPFFVLIHTRLIFFFIVHFSLFVLRLSLTPRHATPRHATPRKQAMIKKTYVRHCVGNKARDSELYLYPKEMEERNVSWDEIHGYTYWVWVWSWIR